MKMANEIKAKFVIPGEGCLICGLSNTHTSHIPCLLLALEAANLAKQIRSQPYWKESMQRR